MQPGSPEHVNLRLDSAQWISTDADRVYFAKLVGEISSCERPGEKLNVAPIEEPYAWRRNYALLEALKLRDRQTRTKAAADLQLASQAAEMNRKWTDYNRDFTWLREFEGRNRSEFRLLCEWVGLEEPDLCDPVPRDGEEGAEWGRRPNWPERAGRGAAAVNKFRGLSPEQRAEIPRIVEERRRQAILKGHDTDIANLFDVVRHLAQRLEAIESRLPSQRETREAADAAA
jgi:hypothetical protein